MATYIIGDIQGCYQDLLALLDRINFQPGVDRLGFVGDLVNRGPDSLTVLRFIRSLPDALVVLGNHDLYLLILGYGLMPEDAYPHTFQEILQAHDKWSLLEWLRQQPLFYVDPGEQFVLVHAGLPPQWSIAESRDHAAEVHHLLHGPDSSMLLSDLFGDEPSSWSDDLRGHERWRYITNAFVRMRYCDRKGRLDMQHKQVVSTAISHPFLPWFQWRDSKADRIKIIFGHWAALNGVCPMPHMYALDTGCGSGRHLTALCWETKQRISVDCRTLPRVEYAEGEIWTHAQHDERKAS